MPWQRICHGSDFFLCYNEYWYELLSGWPDNRRLIVALPRRCVMLFRK
jgi:hypothetical protein